MSVILYVEDHPPAQLLMQAIISDMSSEELLLASSGQEAQAILQIRQPDLYILDLDLPDTDGLSLARLLVELHPAPVILVSAYAESVTEITPPIRFYLAKPLDPDETLALIQRALA